MIKKVTTIISKNKATLAHRALVLGGTVIGAIIADGLLSKINDEQIVTEVVEETDGQPPEETETPETTE